MVVFSLSLANCLLIAVLVSRQVYKSCLANRVLKDPKQPGMLPTSDLNDYFNLAAYSKKEGTLSSALFAGTGSEMSPQKLMKIYNRFDAKNSQKDPRKVLKERENAAKRAGLRRDSEATHHRSHGVKETADDAKQPELSLSLPSCRDLPSTPEGRRELAKLMSQQWELQKKQREMATSAASASKSSDGESSRDQKRGGAEGERSSKSENQSPKFDSGRRSSLEHKHKSEGESKSGSGFQASHRDRQESADRMHEGERRSSSERRHSDAEKRSSGKHGHQRSGDRSSSTHGHSSSKRHPSREAHEKRHSSKKSGDASE